MSQVTLVGDLEAAAIARNVKEDLYEAAGSDGEEEYDPPVIHMLVLGDTIKDICRKYDISRELLIISNRFDEITEEILKKRKFVVIPSMSTFKEYIFEAEDEHHELAKNFCILFNDCTFDQADFYLAKANFNLALAIENYHYDIC